jgi:hypothetical protein
LSAREKLRREWAERLRASGFEDLESLRDPDGPLSDRGNLHPVANTPTERGRLAERMEDGAEYQAWARAILHDGPWKSAQERRIWELHCEGQGDRDIAAALNIKRWRVQAILQAIKARASKRWANQQEQLKERRSWELRRRKWQARKGAKAMTRLELCRAVMRLSRVRSSTGSSGS